MGIEQEEPAKQFSQVILKFHSKQVKICCCIWLSE